MTLRRLAQNARESSGWLIALLGLTIPISVAADGILLGLLLFCLLLALPSCDRHGARRYCAWLPAIIAAALFALLLLSTSYSSASWRAASSFAFKYVDLALIPLFAWAASTHRVRVAAFVAFAIAIALTLCVSFGSVFALWDQPLGLHTRQQYPVGFKLSVTHNILLAFSAFVSLVVALDLRKSAPVWAAAGTAFALICIYNLLFVVIGRTGYMVLAALLTYFVFAHARDTRSALGALLLVAAMFSATYWMSDSFASRVLDAASELTQWRRGVNADTSIGHRMSYYSATLEIVREHPLTGVGAGGFGEAYASLVRGTGAPLTVNPHNDYLMIAAQAGLPALALLLALYVALWRAAPRLGSPAERDMMRGLVLTMAIGGMFNTLLLDHVEGLFFAWATGLLYAGSVKTAKDG